MHIQGATEINIEGLWGSNSYIIFNGSLFLIGKVLKIGLFDQWNTIMHAYNEETYLFIDFCRYSIRG
jgi:hypothetical protein